MDGVKYRSYTYLPPLTDLTWRLAALADFNGDGMVDILWRNTRSGRNLVWHLRTVTFIDSLELPTLADTSWVVGSAGDFNCDGEADIVWRHRVTGENRAWLLSAGALLQEAPIQTLPDTGWLMTAGGQDQSDSLAPDFNRDGRKDLLWHNTVTGQNIIWYMNGTVLRRYRVARLGN